MARYIVGGTVADVVTDQAGNVLGPGQVALFADEDLTVQLTDLLDLAGQPISTAPLDSKGRIGQIMLPDGVISAYAAYVWPGNGQVLPPGQLVVSTSILQDLDARLAAVESTIGNLPGGDGQVIRHTYDEGTEGQLLATGNGIIEVIGTGAKYRAAAGKHGGMGIELAVGEWATWEYQSPNPTATDSQWYVYVTDIGEHDCNLHQFRSSVPGGRAGSVRLRGVGTDGTVGIYDADDNAIVVTSVRWDVGAWIRIDIRSTWDGHQQTIQVWLTVIDSEGAIADDYISAAFDAAIPNREVAGHFPASADWGVRVDTLGLKSGVANQIPAFAPTLPNLLHQFEHNDGSLLTVGIDDQVVVTGSPMISAAAAKHGATGVRSTAATADAWRYALQHADQEWQSIYSNIRTRGAAGSPFLKLYAAGTQIACVINRPNGAIIMGDGASSSVGSQSLHQPSTNNWTRLDYKIAWTLAGGLVFTVRWNYPSADQGEGTTYEELTWTYAGVPEPDQIQVFIDVGWGIDVDTHRTFPGVSATWPGPFQPLVTTVLSSQAATIGPTSAQVSSQVAGGAASISLAYSTTADGSGNPTGSITYLSAAISVDQLVVHTPTGLTEGTTYYAKLSTAPGVFLGDPIRWTTFKTSGAVNLSWFYACCQNNAAGDLKDSLGELLQLGWNDILTAAPQLGWVTGDLHYRGQSLKTGGRWQDAAALYESQLSMLDLLRRVLALVPTNQLADDHDSTANSGDSYNDTIRAYVMTAMKQYFPIVNLGDTSPSPRHLGSSYYLNPRIQVHLWDSMSLDRSPGAMADTIANGKTFLGGPQDTWTRTRLQDHAVVNIIICPKSWVGTGYSETATIPAEHWDKIWNYARWRQAFIDWARSTTNADATLIADTLLMIGGDRHANARMTKATSLANGYGGWPLWVFSGISQDALTKYSGEAAYDYAYGYRDPAHPHTQYPVIQYGRGTILDDNAGTITIAAESREVRDTWDFTADTMTDPDGWTIGTEHSDSDVWTY